MFESSPATSTTTSQSGAFRLCFNSLSNGRSFAFHCDASGEVDLDRLTEQQRNEYFYARAMRGREVAYPAVQAATMH